MASVGGEKFCLTSKDFNVRSCSAIQGFRDEEAFLDVVLVSGDGHQVSAHKLILAANSQFFQDVLKQNPHPCPLIYLKCVKHSDLLLLMSFMYTGEVTVDMEELSSFLKAGEDLEVKGLGERAGDCGGRGSGEEEVTGMAQEQRQIQVMPEVPFEFAMVKTESGSMEAWEEGPGDAQNVPDVENNSQFYEKGEVSEQEVAGVGVITNPTSDQRNQVFGQYMKAVLKEAKSAWECIVCSKQFSWKKNATRHVEALHVHQVFQYKCRYCSKVLNSLSQLGNHEGNHHSLRVKC